MSHCGLVAIYIKKYLLRQKKNCYENSNISPCKNIIFKKNPLKETQILQDIITLLQLISSFNTSQNIIFQKHSYKNKPIITQGPKSLKLLYSIMNLKTIFLPWQARPTKDGFHVFGCSISFEHASQYKFLAQEFVVKTNLDLVMHCSIFHNYGHDQIYQ